MSGDIQRRILAIAAIACLLAAAVLWLWWQPQLELELAFFCRAGGMLAAAWLAYDDIQRLPGWLLLLLPVLLIVIVRWPRLLLLLIPAIIVSAVLRRVLSRG